MSQYCSCYFKYPVCIILKGHVDEQKRLVISEYIEEEMQVSEVVKRLPPFPTIPHINNNETLYLALRKRGKTTDFNLENSSELEDLLGLYKELKDNERIIFEIDIKKDVRTKEQISAFQMLIKAAREKLVNPLIFKGQSEDIDSPVNIWKKTFNVPDW